MSTKYAPGQSGNPKGRPKGTPNKTTQVAKEAFEYAFAATGGKEHLAEWAKASDENFRVFLNLYAKTLPRSLEASVEHTHRTIGELSDDEILALLGRSSSRKGVSEQGSGETEPPTAH